MATLNVETTKGWTLPRLLGRSFHFRPLSFCNFAISQFFNSPSTMHLYLYAIADSLSDTSQFRGVGDEPLVLVRAGRLLVAGGWLEQIPALDRASLSAQDRVVRELHARAEALLPMRFGTTVDSEAELERKIESLDPGLRDCLELVRGREQMTLRVLRATGTAAGARDPDHPTSRTAGEADRGAGASYLEARRTAAVPSEISGLTSAVHSLQRATRIERGRVEGLVATVYQLIDRGSSDAYRAAITQAAATLPALTIRLTGPSPPYAFAAVVPK
jgi:Gas vesicle synthesis protein GvpL/GvpF